MTPADVQDSAECNTYDDGNLELQQGKKVLLVSRELQRHGSVRVSICEEVLYLLQEVPVADHVAATGPRVALDGSRDPDLLASPCPWSILAGCSRQQVNSAVLRNYCGGQTRTDSKAKPQGSAFKTD